MKLSIAIEIVDNEPQFKTIPPARERREPQRPVSTVSANFVAQLAANFLRDCHGEFRERFEPRGIIRSYEAASALAPPASGTVGRQK